MPVSSTIVSAKSTGDGFIDSQTGDILFTCVSDQNKFSFGSSTNTQSTLVLSSAGLIVRGTSAITPVIKFCTNTQNSSEIGNVRFIGNYGGTSNVLSTVSVAYTGQSNSSQADVVFSTSQNAGLLERLRLQSSGNIGIGTSAPNYTLDVNGTINARTLYESNVLVQSKYALSNTMSNYASGIAAYETWASSNYVMSNTLSNLTMTSALYSLSNSNATQYATVASYNNVNAFATTTSNTAYTSKYWQGNSNNNSVFTFSNVGVASSNPVTQKLSVNGSLNATYLSEGGALFASKYVQNSTMSKYMLSHALSNANLSWSYNGSSNISNQYIAFGYSGPNSVSYATVSTVSPAGYAGIVVHGQQYFNINNAVQDTINTTGTWSGATWTLYNGYMNYWYSVYSWTNSASSSSTYIDFTNLNLSISTTGSLYYSGFNIGIYDAITSSWVVLLSDSVYNGRSVNFSSYGRITFGTHLKPTKIGLQFTSGTYGISSILFGTISGTIGYDDYIYNTPTLSVSYGEQSTNRLSVTFQNSYATITAPSMYLAYGINVVASTSTFNWMYSSSSNDIVLRIVGGVAQVFVNGTMVMSYTNPSPFTFSGATNASWKLTNSSSPLTASIYNPYVEYLDMSTLYTPSNVGNIYNNAAIFASNAAYWSSNNQLLPTGGVFTNALTVSAMMASNMSVSNLSASNVTVTGTMTTLATTNNAVTTSNLTCSTISACNVTSSNFIESGTAFSNKYAFSNTLSNYMLSSQSNLFTSSNYVASQVSLVTSASNTALWSSNNTVPISILLPTGTITQYAGSAAPSGWLLCDGTAINRTTYANLFATIGTLYGTGNGTSTFNLPNFSGRQAVGMNSGDSLFQTVGKTGGSSSATMTQSNIPSHTHTITDPGHTHNEYINDHIHAIGGKYIDKFRGGGTPAVDAFSFTENTVNAHVYTCNVQTGFANDITISTPVRGVGANQVQAIISSQGMLLHNAQSSSFGIYQPSILVNFIIKT